MNKIQGYTMGYDLYINDKVKKGCNHNPNDARNIGLLRNKKILIYILWMK